MTPTPPARMLQPFPPRRGPVASPAGPRLSRTSANPPETDQGTISASADPPERSRDPRGAGPAASERRTVFGMDRRVLVLGAARMADAFGNSFLIVVLPLYIASGLVGEGTAGISESLVSGIVLGLFGLVSSVAQPVAGRLSDRAGKRRAFVILGLLLLATANLAFAWTGSYLGLILVRSLQGLGAAFTITAGVALVSELSVLGTRGENMGLYNSLRLIGFGIGPLVAGVVVEGGPYALPRTAVELTGFHVAFGMAAISALVSAVLVARYVEDPDETRPTTERVAIRFLAREGPGLLDPIFTLGIATFLMAACIALLAPIEPEINRRLGQGAILFSVEFSALIAALALVQPVVGRLSDVRGRRGYILAGLVGLAPTTLIQGLVTTPWGMVAARLAQGVSAALVLAPALALAGDLARRGQTGSQLSVLTVAFGLGISAGQLASGYLVRYGVPAPFAAGAAASLLGVAAVATQVRETVELPGSPSRDPAGPAG